MKDRFATQLRETEPGFQELLGSLPPQGAPPLPPNWLACEMLERYQVLAHGPPLEGRTIVEVGSGAHAISTVPLAYRAGARGRVVAIERSRWTHFRSIVEATGLGDRIFPVSSDARRLPLKNDSADLAVCVHGVRSLQGETNVREVLREMLRVAPRILVAESLPVARTDSQRAHLEMYGLRQELFRAASGGVDDLPYEPLDGLRSLAESAGARVDEVVPLEVDLPHFLAYFPRDLVEALPESRDREDLLRRWDRAERMRARWGEDHPPVGIVTAARK